MRVFPFFVFGFAIGNRFLGGQSWQMKKPRFTNKSLVLTDSSHLVTSFFYRRPPTTPVGGANTTLDLSSLRWAPVHGSSRLCSQFEASGLVVCVCVCVCSVVCVLVWLFVDSCLSSFLFLVGGFCLCVLVCFWHLVAHFVALARVVSFLEVEGSLDSILSLGCPSWHAWLKLACLYCLAGPLGSICWSLGTVCAPLKSSRPPPLHGITHGHPLISNGFPEWSVDFRVLSMNGIQNGWNP